MAKKKTTCTDLQGFWEMIYYEVEKIIKDFSDLDTIEKDGWKITKSEPIIPERKMNEKLSKKPAITNGEKKVSTTRKPSSNIKEIMAMKRKEMALAKKQSLEAEIIGDVKTSSTTEKLASPLIDIEKEKVFDGGFFNVQSPVSSLKNTPNSIDQQRTPHSFEHPKIFKKSIYVKKKLPKYLAYAKRYFINHMILCVIDLNLPVCWSAVTR